MHAMPAQSWISYTITGAVILLVLALRLRNVNRARRLRLETLWIIPALYACVAVAVFWSLPPHGLVWLWCALALAVGAVAGWYRGKMMAISVDPRTHLLNQTASPTAMLFMVALILVRAMSRTIALSIGGTAHGGVSMVTDLLVAFALGFLAVQRLEMFLRARRLLAQARRG